MPYRYAHHLILFVLAPTILVAFWPKYFGDLPHASWVFHAHGLTATAWITLVAAQSWTVHSGRFALHRAVGRAVFPVATLFAGGAALAMQGEALKFVTKSDPFYAALGSMLGLDDLLSTIVLLGFARAALVHRRRAHWHGGYVLVTLLLVLPPIVARLPVPAPPGGLLSHAIAVLPAVPFLFSVKHRRPFAIFLAVHALKSVTLAVVGFSAGWVVVFSTLPDLPPALLALPAMGLAFAALWSAWRPVWWVKSARPATATGN